MNVKKMMLAVMVVCLGMPLFAQSQITTGELKGRIIETADVQEILKQDEDLMQFEELIKEHEKRMESIGKKEKKMEPTIHFFLTRHEVAKEILQEVWESKAAPNVTPEQWERIVEGAAQETRVKELVYVSKEKAERGEKVDTRKIMKMIMHAKLVVIFVNTIPQEDWGTFVVIGEGPSVPANQ